MFDRKQNDVVDTPSVHLQCGDTMCKEVTLIGENKPADRNDITTEVDQEGEKSDMLSRYINMEVKAVRLRNCMYSSPLQKNKPWMLY